jgi:hypothetical protein
MWFDAPPAVVCEVEADARTDVIAAFQSQMDAWNQGDLETALSLYWDNADIRWVGRSGTYTGYDDFAESMRADFSDPATMGLYTGETLYAEQLRPDLVLLVISWRIERDGERLFGGVSSQHWRLIDGNWRIVFEHAG